MSLNINGFQQKVAFKSLNRLEYQDLNAAVNAAKQHLKKVQTDGSWVNDKSSYFNAATVVLLDQLNLKV